jgi:hypothetical protein
MGRKQKANVAEVASNALIEASGTIFRIAVAVFVAILAYWCFIIFTGQLKDATASGVPVINATGHLFLLSGVLAAGTLAILTSEDITLTVVLAVIGVGLILGVPALLLGQIGPESAWHDPVKILNNLGILTGKAIIVVVALRVIYEIYRTQAEQGIRKEASAREQRERDRSLGRRNAVKAAPKESPLAKCWEMPFCHEAVRELCPAFKAKKPCWKFGRGCNCDADLIDTLVMNRNPGPSRMAREVEAEYIRTDLQADTIHNRSERTIPCSKCPIYTEHQRRKFKIVNPVLVAGMLVVLFVLWGPLTAFYSVLAQHLAALASGNALNHAHAAENLAYWQSYLDTPALAACFVVIIGLFALAWILKFSEWLVLEKKLV